MRRAYLPRRDVEGGADLGGARVTGEHFHYVDYSHPRARN